ncbi:MAG: ATP-binding cassette domain-containing protein [Planctomycetes bacterium]|nr:ATP-binding cassette domain-containing protein [Planctomycetota bacterium]
MLEVVNIETSYGASQVLFGLSLDVGEGEVVTLLGRNGMGKSTTIRSIMGILRPHAGEIRFAGVPIHGLPSYQVAQAGIGLVPEGRQLFPNLSLKENLVATAANRRGDRDPWTLEKVLDLFPALAERLKSPWAGMLVSGFLFAAIHPQGPSGWPPLLAVGFMAALVTYQTGSLLPAMVLLEMGRLPTG